MIYVNEKQAKVEEALLQKHEVIIQLENTIEGAKFLDLSNDPNRSIVFISQVEIYSDKKKKNCNT